MKVAGVAGLLDQLKQLSALHAPWDTLRSGLARTRGGEIASEAPSELSKLIFLSTGTEVSLRIKTQDLRASVLLSNSMIRSLAPILLSALSASALPSVPSSIWSSCGSAPPGQALNSYQKSKNR